MKKGKIGFLLMRFQHTFTKEKAKLKLNFTLTVQHHTRSSCESEIVEHQRPKSLHVFDFTIGQHMHLPIEVTF